MIVAYSKDELRKLYGFLTILQWPNPKPLTAEQAVELGGLVTKTEQMIGSSSGLHARGEKIFEWRLHAEDAPTQNQIRGFAFGSPFTLKSKEKRLDTLLANIIDVTPRALVHGDRTRRWVRVTRFSRSRVDDPTAVDAIGGKMAIDALVRAGVLNGDNEEFCRREGGCRSTTGGNVHVLVEVFEMAEEEVFDPGPQDQIMGPRKPAKRTFTHDVLKDADLLPADIVPTTLLKTSKRRSARAPR